MAVATKTRQRRQARPTDRTPAPPRGGVQSDHVHDHSHDHALAHTEDASWRLSKAASWAVSACAVHCIITPFAAGILPLVGVGVFTSPWVEWSLVALAAVLGGVGFWLSYARVHRRTRPFALFGVGLAMLVATHSLLEANEILHTVGAVLGAVVILVAGRVNHSLVHACEHCHPHPHG